ncbi:hypothetical protein CRUP_016040, partial [Coryphaenoides rupestris]
MYSPASLPLDLVPSVGEELEAVRDQINVVHIDRVVDHLRLETPPTPHPVTRQSEPLVDQDWRPPAQPQPSSSQASSVQHPK